MGTNIWEKLQRKKTHQLILPKTYIKEIKASHKKNQQGLKIHLAKITADDILGEKKRFNNDTVTPVTLTDNTLQNLLCKFQGHIFIRVNQKLCILPFTY